MLLPQIYIGLKGIKIAKTPDSSKAHVVWGIILLVLTVLGLIPLIVEIVQSGDVLANVVSCLSIALDSIVLGGYVKYASIVAKEN